MGSQSFIYDESGSQVSITCWYCRDITDSFAAKMEELEQMIDSKEMMRAYIKADQNSMEGG